LDFKGIFVLAVLVVNRRGVCSRPITREIDIGRLSIRIFDKFAVFTSGGSVFCAEVGELLMSQGRG